MDIESNHSSPVLADPAPINKARLGIHSNLLTYAPSGGSLSSSKYRNIPRKKPGKLDEVCSNACLDAMKSSSPPRKKLIKDGSDTTYSTWMVMLASLLVDSLGNATVVFFKISLMGGLYPALSNDHPNCTETTTDQQGKEVNLFQPAREFIPMIDEVFRTLVESTKGIKGAKVENHKFCVSVHFRNVDEKVGGDYCSMDEIPLSLRHLPLYDFSFYQDVVEEYPRLRKTHGRKVLEVRPMIDWNKGKAVEFLLESLGAPGGESRLWNFGVVQTQRNQCSLLSQRSIGGDEISQFPGDMEEGGCILKDTGGPSDDLQT
ncbi:hypothetical protein OIU84_022445 [Salix udensis]|uniref:trehalose-phosphatase n=1 Tax=Salix udensis TaxID=889485 RepID=A0AAD6KQ18_9ROSI|nr:hypothetical protein OIU84_022445 [Salix udensis]KAJ6426856.1 hypothetical protein OIU84_022445 [Salix udensis]